MQSTSTSLHDVVHNMTTDQRFRQLQKLEAVGRLAGGVAHDFNNLLTVILGCCQMLQEEHRGNPRSAALLKEIEHAGERASELTRQLLLFSRNVAPETEVLNLNAVIKGFVKMLHRLIGDNIELETDLDPKLCNVRADPGQIEQVIMNLVINARDAMPKGGKLRIETRTQVLTSASDSETGGVPAGTWATLVVRDMGCGMTSEVLAHLFEPFFTTKPTGKGTGLGLATVYGIVSQSGGHIRVASKLGLGTRFRIYLPAVSEPLAGEDAPPTPKPKVRGTETILLVEDDPALRKLAALSLRSGGYTVLEAAHGGEALTLAAAYGRAIKLVVSDVIMPLVTGPQLAQRLLAEYPDLKILYMSGYTDSLLAPHDEQDIRGSFLQKPFTPEVLLTTVRQLLG